MGKCILAGHQNTEELTAHLGRRDNPHGVTAAQVGAVIWKNHDAGISGADMNNANYSYAYESTLSDGPAIGLPPGWWHIKYFRHGDNNGFGAQIAVGLNCGNQVMYRTSGGTSWQKWAAFIDSDNLAVSLPAAGGARIAGGTYTGTGTFGRENPCILTVGFRPMFAMVCRPDGFGISTYDSRFSPVFSGGFIWCNGVTSFYSIGARPDGQRWGESIDMIPSETTFSWSSLYSGAGQHNARGALYGYVIIG